MRVAFFSKFHQLWMKFWKHFSKFFVIVYGNLVDSEEIANFYLLKTNVAKI